MTRRAWIVLVVGVLISAGLGGFVLIARGQASGFKPSASAGAFTSAAWNTVKQRITNRGFNTASIRVVTATGGPQSGNTLALLTAARPSGAHCFILAHGNTLGAPICGLAKSVTIFTARDHFSEIGPNGHPHSVAATAVVGLVRHDIASVVLSWKILGRPNVQGMPLMAVPGGFAFGAGFRGTSGTLIARDAHGKAVYQLDLPLH